MERSTCKIRDNERRNDVARLAIISIQQEDGVSFSHIARSLKVPINSSFTHWRKKRYNLSPENLARVEAVIKRHQF